MEQTTKLKNKWNSKTYFLVKDSGATVILKRSDDSEFEISKSELHFNYREVDNDKKQNT